MNRSQSPCDACERRELGCVNHKTCKDWTAWFRSRWRAINAILHPPADKLERRERRRKQKEYLRMLYRGETGGWK